MLTDKTIDKLFPILWCAIDTFKQDIAPTTTNVMLCAIEIRKLCKRDLVALLCEYNQISYDKHVNKEDAYYLERFVIMSLEKYI
jgi:hypothetical protein